MDDFPIVPPPASVTVEWPRRPLLYLPDGRMVVRQIGFSPTTETWHENPPR